MLISQISLLFWKPNVFCTSTQQKLPWWCTLVRNEPDSIITPRKLTERVFPSHCCPHLAPSLASSITPALCIHVNVPILSANTLRPAPYRKSAMDSFVFLTASSYVVLTLKSPCWLVNLWRHLAFLVSHKHSYRFLHKGWQHNVGIMSQSMMTSCHLICYLHISVVTAEKIFSLNM